MKDWVERNRRTLAVASMTASMALWIGLEPVFGRLSAYSPFQVVWTRYVFHVVLMAAVLLPFRGARLWRTRRLPLQIVRGSMMLGVVVFFTIGVQVAKKADVRAVFLAAPLLLLPLAWGWLREPVRWPVWLMTGLAAAGGWLVFRPTPAVLDAVLHVPAGMAICFAFYLAMTRKLAQEDVLTNVFYSGVVVCAGLTVTVPGVWKTPAIRDLGAMLIIGIVGILILTTLEWAIHVWEASRLAPLLFLRPAIAVLLGMSRPTKEAVLGAGIALAVAAVVLLGAVRDDGSPGPTV